MNLQRIDVAQLGALTKIGQGAQGVVYRAQKGRTQFAPAVVYKQYKAKTLVDVNFDVLEEMPRILSEVLSPDNAAKLVSVAAWPCAIVNTDGEPTGFAMPEIPSRFMMSLETVAGAEQVPAQFQYLLNSSDFLLARGIDLDDRRRLKLLYEVAAALSLMHKLGICVGDISPKNLLFSSAIHDDVYFVDCDTMRIHGVSALPQLETPGWEVPPGEETGTIFSDTYKFGLLALRLFASDQETKDPRQLPSAVPAALRRLIAETLDVEPVRRPSLSAWRQVLESAAVEVQRKKVMDDRLTMSPLSDPGSVEIPRIRSRSTTASQGGSLTPTTKSAKTSTPPSRMASVNPGVAVSQISTSSARWSPNFKLGVVAAMVLAIIVAGGFAVYLAIYSGDHSSNVERSTNAIMWAAPVGECISIASGTRVVRYSDCSAGNYRITKRTDGVGYLSCFGSDWISAPGLVLCLDAT